MLTIILKDSPQGVAEYRSGPFDHLSLVRRDLMKDLHLEGSLGNNPVTHVATFDTVVRQWLAPSGAIGYLTLDVVSEEDKCYE